MKLGLAVVCLGVSLSSSAFAQVINVPPDIAPSDIYVGTTLNLHPGGTLPYNFNAHQNSELNVHGGHAEGRLLVQGLGRVNVYGGLVGGSGPYSHGRSILANNEAIIYVAGGTIGDGFVAEGNTSITFEGYDFRLGGVLIDGLDQPGNTKVVSVDLTDGVTDFSFTGILADGTPFCYSVLDGDEFDDVTLVRSADLVSYPTELEINEASSLAGSLPGQTVRVLENGSLANHFGAARGSRVEVMGGTIGENFEADGAQLVVTDGTIGQYFSAIHGASISLQNAATLSQFRIARETTMDITDSSINSIEAMDQSHIEMKGGTLGSLTLRRGSTADLSDLELLGGISIGDNSHALIHSGDFGRQIGVNSSSLRIEGGNFAGGGIVASEGSEVVIVGHDFRIDGAPLVDFGPDYSLLLTNRGGAVLSADLVDGSLFEMPLYQPDGRPGAVGMYLSPDSQLRIVLAVPEPGTMASAVATLLAVLILRSGGKRRKGLLG